MTFNALDHLINFISDSTKRFFSVIAPGDTVNIIGQFDEGGSCDIGHENNFLIVHPDILLSGTRSLLYLPLAIANALTARLNDGVPLVNEKLVLLGFCAYTVTLYLHFATTVIHEITNALGICCFRITRKEA
ncbi:choline/ethanolaminephosphotransferase 1-like isoform X2 [Arachis stenosperma]|uniref:choline/ethanolaminephosphotransferase 1-like isoform X2 n=1 Tax=Arachis stenosperma TaxID=217475 RepID=UPI0025AC917C|nr:choline/ethanolaminephosphotransferase 1-like isoform X2 [Arachis stenosperma]